MRMGCQLVFVVVVVVEQEVQEEGGFTRETVV